MWYYFIEYYSITWCINYTIYCKLLKLDIESYMYNIVYNKIQQSRAINIHEYMVHITTE